MKINKKIKVIFIISGIALISAALPVAHVSAKVFDRDLYLGMQGDMGITLLQRFLKNQGLYNGPITGNFFSLTLNAVKAFQIREGITPASGYFGPLTRAMANMVISAQSQSSGQQSGSDVATSTTSSSSSNIILCNGKRWLPCTTGQFVCPSSGDAQCVTPSATPSQSNTPLSSEINTYYAIAYASCRDAENKAIENAKGDLAARGLLGSGMGNKEITDLEAYAEQNCKASAARATLQLLYPNNPPFESTNPSPVRTNCYFTYGIGWSVNGINCTTQ